MTQYASRAIILLLCIIIIVAGLIAHYNLVHTENKNKPIVHLIYASSGSVLQLLDTGQIDGFLVWEPIPEEARLSGVGKIVANVDDLPPKHFWAKLPCCVLVIRNSVIEKNPEIATLLSALTIAGNEFILENTSDAINDTTRWLYGSKNIIVGQSVLNPHDVETESFKELDFNYPRDPGGSQNIGNMKNMVYNRTGYVSQTGIMEDAYSLLYNNTTKLYNSTDLTINIGYLSTDHHAPLFVLMPEWSSIYSRYGIAIAPDKEPSGKKQLDGTILVREDGKDISVAKIHLVPGQSGGGLMTAVGQGAIDAAFVGSVPAMTQINLGNPSQIIQPVQAGGSSLVVDPGAPCTDWTSFVSWGKNRSDSGVPLKIATVQSSIQEDMIRESLKTEGFSVELV